MTSNRNASILALALATTGFWGCAPTLPRSPERTPVRWIMVEKRASDIAEGGWVGDGRVDPQAVVLTMQPLYREDLDWEVVVDSHDYFVEVLEISPSRLAAPGETVSATVRVGRARPKDLYRLTARASQAGVNFVGDRTCVVWGSTPASFRFTSLEPGRAGIAVGVELLEGEGP